MCMYFSPTREDFFPLVSSACYIITVPESNIVISAVYGPFNLNSSSVHNLELKII